MFYCAHNLEEKKKCIISSYYNKSFTFLNAHEPGKWADYENVSVFLILYCKKLKKMIKKNNKNNKNKEIKSELSNNKSIIFKRANAL